MIVAMLIWISQQINWEFFTFDQKKCISEYLFARYEKYEEVERMTYKEIEIASQIWDLDKTELHKIREDFPREWEEYRAKWDKCWEKYGKKSIPGKGYLSLSEQPKEFQECVNSLKEPTSYTPFKDFIKDKKPVFSSLPVKELVSEGICARPLILK